MMQLILAGGSLLVTLPAIAHEVRILHRFDAAGVPSLLQPITLGESE